MNNEFWNAKWADVRTALVFLWRRMGALRLPQVAGSLSYTSVLSMVPLLVIVLSILTILPQFQGFQKEIEHFMTENLLPAKMSKTVMQQITIFTQRSSSLSLIGGVLLIISAISTVSIIDRAFDDIWRIKKRPPFRSNVAIYWSILTLGPFVFGGALFLVNSVVNHLRAFALLSSFLGWVLPFGLALLSFAALYVFVPNRRVRWADAWVGGAVAAVIFTLLTHTFSAVFKSFSGYAILYGAFSILPAIFLWLYVFWWGILFGAGIAANLPVLKYERWRQEPRVGERLSEALMLLFVLYQAQCSQQPETRLLRWSELQARMRMNSEELAFVIEVLQLNAWVGKIERANGGFAWGLICDVHEVELRQIYHAFVHDAPYFWLQAERAQLPWAPYLQALTDLPAHRVSLYELFSATS